MGGSREADLGMDIQDQLRYCNTIALGRTSWDVLEGPMARLLGPARKLMRVSVTEGLLHPPSLAVVGLGRI